MPPRAVHVPRLVYGWQPATKGHDGHYVSPPAPRHAGGNSIQDFPGKTMGVGGHARLAFEESLCDDSSSNACALNAFRP